MKGSKGGSRGTDRDSKWWLSIDPYTKCHFIWGRASSGGWAGLLTGGSSHSALWLRPWMGPRYVCYFMMTIRFLSKMSRKKVFVCLFCFCLLFLFFVCLFFVCFVFCIFAQMSSNRHFYQSVTQAVVIKNIHLNTMILTNRLSNF